MTFFIKSKQRFYDNSNLSQYNFLVTRTSPLCWYAIKFVWMVLWTGKLVFIRLFLFSFYLKILSKSLCLSTSTLVYPLCTIAFCAVWNKRKKRTKINVKRVKFSISVNLIAKHRTFSFLCLIDFFLLAQKSHSSIGRFWLWYLYLCIPFAALLDAYIYRTKSCSTY